MSAVASHNCLASLELWSHLCPASEERIILYIVSPGKDPNSIFQVQFLLNAYRFCSIINLKNHQWNHRKLVTVCILQISWIFGLIRRQLLGSPFCFCIEWYSLRVEACRGENQLRSSQNRGAFQLSFWIIMHFPLFVKPKHQVAVFYQLVAP